MQKISRREFVAGAAAAAAWTTTACAHRAEREDAAVSITRAPAYDQRLYATLREVVGEHLRQDPRLQVRDKHVVLKPNLVEYDAHTAINTHPLLVHAAMEAFRAHGAAGVRIAEGPGHRRTTLDLAEAAGYYATIPDFEALFTDLNLDDVVKTPIARPLSRLRSLYLPHAALGAELLVSLPKMKTHHWVGATLSMKNLFGLVPGGVYGWPKNVLHWAGIDECIADIHTLAPPTFAIVDGIVGMEGNGPIQGKPKAAGVLVAGRSLPAVDAACCRVMGINPNRIGYLRMAGLDESRIRHVGTPVAQVRQPFELTREFQSIRG